MATKPVPTGLRGVLQRFAASSRLEVPAEISPIVEAVRRAHPKVDLNGIVSAFRVAEQMHSGQARKSGEAFITHPVEVAQILADMGMDPVSVISALLHDCVEDTDATLDDIEKAFGPEVSKIIDGLTKIAKVRFVSLEHARAENYRKMLVAMADDARVIIIKLADRLHNMRTLGALAEDRRELKAAETLEIYVPLAARLGMSQLRTELEELAFKHRYPKRYAEVSELVERRQPERERLVEQVQSEINDHLSKAKIRASVSGRAKNYYSVYMKMVARGTAFDEIFDLVGLRILVDDLPGCYTALGVVHTLYVPMPGRFKDYIAQPKFNLYQSLHTTVVGPGGKPLEIQIRTQAMHEMAEFGIAAHWRYKESSKKARANDVPWLGEIVEAFRETTEPGEFLDALRLDLFADEVFVFTPRGDVECLPRGATPVDFAYAIHTEVGHRCVGSRVNGKLMPLDTELESGDVVEIVTAKGEGNPKQDWLTFVKTSRARGRIKQWLTSNRREESRERGREMFVKILRRENVAFAAMDDDAWRTVISQTRVSGPETLYEALAEGRVDPKAVTAIIRGLFREAEIEREPDPEPTLAPRKRRSLDGVGVTVAGAEDIAVKLARCCSPVPGDSIFGFVTRGRGVSIHRDDCPNADSLQLEPERIMAADWSGAVKGRFGVTLQIAAMDREGLIRDVADSMSNLGIFISNSQSWSRPDGTARLRFAFEIADVDHLSHVIRAVKGIDGVFDVYRLLPLPKR